MTRGILHTILDLILHPAPKTAKCDNIIYILIYIVIFVVKGGSSSTTSNTNDFGVWSQSTCKSGTGCI